MVMHSILSKLNDKELWKSTIIYSIGWIIFVYVLSMIETNGVLQININTIALIFSFAIAYNLALSFLVPGRFR